MLVSLAADQMDNRAEPAQQLNSKMRSVGNVYNPKPEPMPKSANADEARRVKSQAIEIACDIRLHQSFMLPAKPGNGRDKPIRVTYSDLGRSAVPADGLDKPVILWAGGMFGGRYQGWFWDEVAQDWGVRIVAVDRPGIGGTGAVPLEHRIDTWLDIVPALLSHLDIKFVSLAGHSAGTMFVLSTALQLRHLLHPERPYLTLFGPWIPPRHSGRWTMTAVQAFPPAVINRWAGFAGFVHNYIGPVLAFSAPVFSTTPFRKKQGTVPTAQEEIDDEERDKIGAAVQNFITKYVFKEDTEGANDEALLCLDKGKTNWPGVAQVLRKMADAEKTPRDSGGRGKLRIQVFYAEDDEMVGKGGEAYLDNCLREAGAGGVFHVDRFVVEGTDHNCLIMPDYGAPAIVMQFLCGATSTANMDTGQCKMKD